MAQIAKEGPKAFHRETSVGHESLSQRIAYVINLAGDIYKLSDAERNLQLDPKGDTLLIPHTNGEIVAFTYKGDSYSGSISYLLQVWKPNLSNKPFELGEALLSHNNVYARKEPHYFKTDGVDETWLDSVQSTLQEVFLTLRNF